MIPMISLSSPWDTGFAALALLLPVALAVLALIPASSHLAFRLTPWAALPALVLAVSEPISVHWPSVLLGTRLATGEIGSIWLLVTAVLWICAGWFGTYYLAHDQHRGRYTFYFLGAMAGNLGVVLSRDPASFFTAFATMSILSYGLIIHDGKPESRLAGRVYLAMAVLGEVLQVAALALLLFPMIGKASDLDFQTLETLGATQPWTVVLLIAGFGIKAGLLGLHLWLPMAHPVAPTPASAVLSGSMIKAGLIGWMAFLPLGRTALPEASMVLIVLGLAGAVVAATLGSVQRHPKAVLAYSSVSQMGLMITGIGVGLGEPLIWPVMKWAVVVYAAHHAFAKCLLFLSVGIKTSRPLGGWERTLFWGGSLFAALALVGGPFTSGAIAKQILKDSVATSRLDGMDGVVLVLTLAAVGTALLMIRFVMTLRPLTGHGHHASRGLWIPWTVLLVLVMGFTLGLTRHLTVDLQLFVLKPSAWWKSVWPLAVGLIAYFGIVELWRRAGWKALGLPAGDVFFALAGLARLLVRGSEPARVECKMRWDHLNEHPHRQFRKAATLLGRRMAQLEASLAIWSVGSLAALAAAVVVFVLANR